jgi:glycosyltransferase involved in cell wall biosynthesis
LHKLGATNVEVYSQLGLSEDEISQLAKYAHGDRHSLKFISIGRLLHWKGFHLGLRAFALADLPNDAEYWIVGEGSERERLESLAEDLGISHQVKFWHKLSRKDTLDRLGKCTALIHPSLHESGGLVCLEAMGAGCPVICLNLGGPAIGVTEETGFKIAADTPEQAVFDLAQAMKKIVQDSSLRMQMGQAGQKRVREEFAWEVKGRQLAQLYEKIVNCSRSQE